MSFARQTWRHAMTPVDTRARAAVGLAMRQRHIDIVVGDGAATIQAQVSLPQRELADVTPLIPNVVQTVRALLDEQNISVSSLCGIGMGVPMSALTQVAAAGPDLGASLHDAFGVPACLDTHTNMAALGENRYGAGQGVGDMLYVALGATVTAGIILNGKLHRGSAGAIGHMALDPHGAQCHCGQRGCLEASAGAAAIIATAQGQGSAVTTIAEVIAAANHGDVGSRAALEQAGVALGRAIANAVVMLNPALVVVGGATINAGDLLMMPVRQTIMQYHRLAGSVPFTIVPGILGGNAAALGGMAAALDRDTHSLGM